MSDQLPATAKAPPGESRGSKLRQDTVAGLINAVVSVPDGLASAALAGVNPVYGLYTSIAAPIAGGVLKSAQLMQIDRLDDVVIRTRFQPANTVHFLGPCRQHNHGDTAGFWRHFQATTDLYSRKTRHHPIKDDDIGGFFGHQ